MKSYQQVSGFFENTCRPIPLHIGVIECAFIGKLTKIFSAF